jgi:hypothetical protein
MSTDEHWSPHSRLPPRSATSRDVLWVLTKPPHTQRTELLDFGDVGVELQTYVDDEFVNGRHFETRALALINAHTLCETAKLAGIDPHAYAVRALYAAIATPGAITYPEDLLNAAPTI